MKYCQNCGSKLEENQNICPNCGFQQSNIQRNQPQNYSNQVDNGGFGWGFLGFCIPMVGLILYLVWKTEKPITAKAAGIGALIGFGLSIVSYVIYFFILAGLMATI